MSPGITIPNEMIFLIFWHAFPSINVCNWEVGSRVVFSSVLLFFQMASRCVRKCDDKELSCTDTLKNRNIHLLLPFIQYKFKIQHTIIYFLATNYKCGSALHREINHFLHCKHIAMDSILFSSESEV